MSGYKKTSVLVVCAVCRFCNWIDKQVYQREKLLGRCKCGQPLIRREKSGND